MPTSQRALTTPARLSLTDLTPEQVAGIDYAYEHDQALLACKMGYGKAVVSLTAAQELLRDGVVTRVLVLAPLRVCDLVWRTEPAKWSHLDGLDVAVATGSVTDRLRAIESGAPIVAINFENLVWFFKTFGRDHGFDGLIVDELTKLQTVGGAWFKKLRHRLKDFHWRVGLTGSLADEGLVPLYGMCMVIDGGEALGRNKQVFLETWFTPTDYHRRQWEPKPGALEGVSARISGFVFHADDSDQNLPELLEDYRFIDMPTSARDQYEQLVKDQAAEIGGLEVLAVNNGVLQGKLQQVCAGFVYATDAEDVRQAIVLHRAGSEAVWDEFNRADEPAMIIYQYQWQLAELKALFPLAGVFGDGTSRVQAMKWQDAWNARELNVLLVHPNSAGHGLNIQYGGRRIIGWGPLWSRDKTAQIIARLRRRGQPEDYVKVTWIVARNTVEDLVIVPRVMGKADSAAAFSAHLESILRG